MGKGGPYKFTNHTSKFRWIHWIPKAGWMNMEKYDAHRSIVHRDCQFFHNFTDSMIEYCMYFKCTSMINGGLMSLTSTISWMIIFIIEPVGSRYFVCMLLRKTKKKQSRLKLNIYLCSMENIPNLFHIHIISSLATRTNRSTTAITLQFTVNIFPIGIWDVIYEDFNVTM